MSIITSAAFFSVCPCHTHARIVFADGSKGLEVCSIAGGLREFEQMKNENGRLLKEELPELKRQIFHSGLPREDTDAGFLERLCVESINTANDEDRTTDQSVEDEIQLPIT